MSSRFSGNSSLALLFTAHIACLLGCGCLYSIVAVVLGVPSVVQASPNDVISAATLLIFHQKSFPGSLQGLWPCCRLPSLSYSPWPLHVFKAITTWETLTYYQLQLPAWGTALLPSGTQLWYTDPEETLPRRFVFNNFGLFLTPADSSAPDDHHQLSQQSKNFSCSGLLLVIAQSSASDDWNHILNSKYQFPK